MPKKAYTGAVKLLRNITELSFFGWVDDDYHVDAIAYLPHSELPKLASLLALPEKVRKLMSMEITPQYIRLVVPKINSEPMINYLSEVLSTVGSIKESRHLNEQRILRVATVSMPTGSFAKSGPRTIKEQVDLFHSHVHSSYNLMNKQAKLFSDELAICVMPEFYSHCSVGGQSTLFMPHDTQKELLAGYCNVSKHYPSLLIMVNLTATTPTEVTDAEGLSIGHKPKTQKTNMLLGIKDGVVVYASYKLNKGPADIPEAELTSMEAERNTYWQGQIERELMPLAYFKQYKGITIAGSICVDAAEGVLGKYLRKQFADFNTDEFGPAIQIISSSSMALPIFKKRQEMDPNQVVTPQISQGLIIQADGHDKLKRSGVWLVEGENFIRQKAASTTVLDDGVCIESYSISVNLLHNKLHDYVGDDIDDRPKASK
ncbi:hypothetical protein [Legionella hackeliae]|uniref:Uncharacterized protein n=1 Tax=Legionella hackeliae TaxID=449 RepID=A0A0A8UNT1_LEGHA|nr:hypothetical protein [Legionella hackeliae]KTD13819.1 hypothetical protein Lhac_0663 [Legionella hackeliae]CEK10520.1 protein of unknown function [Legionella hackeliae]STX47257.1 Uncharacterised protein [Legionella hackeliae]